MEEKETYYSSTHKAEITREVRKSDTAENFQKACASVKKAGELVAPPGTSYIGSACFHIYGHQTGEAWSFVSQPLTGTAPEHVADYGWKELRKALMRFYGRPEPRTNTKV